MSWLGGSHLVRVLMASVALLLPAGVLSATVVDPPSPSSVAADSALPAPPDATTTTSTAPAVIVPTTKSPSSTIAVTTTTTRRPSTASTPTTAKALTTSTVASGRPPIQTIPTTPRTPVATSWVANKNGVSARVRLEPASPIAGQSVRFVIDVSSAEDCCIIAVFFGDGSESASNLTEVCSGSEVLTPGAFTFETDNVYGSPGAYRAGISIDAGGQCPQSAPPGGRAGTSDVVIDACFAVGPAPAGQDGCTPRPAIR